MTRKIKIKIKNLDEHEFYLEENAKKGDYFCLDDIGAFSIDYIKEEFNSKINKIVDERTNEKLIIEKINWENKFKSSDEYLNLRNEVSTLKSDLDSNKKMFEEKLRTLENEKKTEFELKSKNLILEKDNEINKLNLEINKMINENNIKERSKDDIYNYEIKKLNDEIDRQRKIIEKREIKNIKLIGEDFEGWISNQFDKYYPMNKKVTLEKITKSEISGDKTIPDFKFSVFDENSELLSSVTIEAKTETNSGKTKNSIHYEKLNKEREKLKSEYAILVSELEPENTFLIKKVHQYENMFVIRPAYLITFLMLIEYISNEKQGIKRLQLEFKDKQKISKEFDEMKNKILNNSLKHLNTQCKEIEKQIGIIENSSSKIRSSIKVVLEKHICGIEDKIKEFKIESVKKKIEKLDLVKDII